MVSDPDIQQTSATNRPKLLDSLLGLLRFPSNSTAAEVVSTPKPTKDSFPKTLIHQYRSYQIQNDEVIDQLNQREIDILTGIEQRFQERLAPVHSELVNTLSKFDIGLIEDDEHVRLETRLGLARFNTSELGSIDQCIIAECGTVEEAIATFVEQPVTQRPKLLILDSDFPLKTGYKSLTDDNLFDELDGPRACALVLQAIKESNHDNIYVIIRSAITSYITNEIGNSFSFVLGIMSKGQIRDNPDDLVFQGALLQREELVNQLIDIAK